MFQTCSSYSVYCLYCIDVTCLRHNSQAHNHHNHNHHYQPLNQAMTGWRLGFGLFPNTLVEPARNLAINSWTCLLAKTGCLIWWMIFFPTHALVVLVVQGDEMLDCGFRYLFYVHFYMVQIFILTYTFQMG